MGNILNQANYKDLYTREVLSCLVFIVLLCAPFTSICSAAENPKLSRTKMVSVGYLHPTDDDRHIETINVDYHYLVSRSQNRNLSIYFGITATHAEGNITRDGKLYKSTAFGIGPGVLASYKAVVYSKFKIYINVSGNLILYSERFPAGADYYNFMWLAGPMLEFKIGKARSLGINYSLMHVSNGQHGLKVNPSYDAEGVILSYKGSF